METSIVEDLYVVIRRPTDYTPAIIQLGTFATTDSAARDKFIDRHGSFDDDKFMVVSCVALFKIASSDIVM